MTSYSKRAARSVPSVLGDVDPTAPATTVYYDAALGGKEAAEDGPVRATDVAYDNDNSGLAADDVQAAIDELVDYNIGQDGQIADLDSRTQQATEDTAGLAEIATQGECDAGLDSQRIVTPLTMAAYVAAHTIDAPAASEELAGIAELATQAETDAGIDDARIVTPLKLKPTRDAVTALDSRLTVAESDIDALQAMVVPASETVAGIAELATQVEVDAGADDLRIVTPLKLAQRIAAIPAVPVATETVAGIAELATQAEANAGTDDARILTALKLRNFTGQMLGPVTLNSTMTVTGMAVFSGDVKIDNTPVLYLQENAAETNAKVWSIYAYGGELWLTARNDDLSHGSYATRITRSGNAITEHQLYTGGNVRLTVNNAGCTLAGVTTCTNNVTSAGTFTSEGPFAGFYAKDTDGGIDAKMWRFYSLSGTLKIDPMSDDGSVAGNFLTATRSGTAVSEINITNNAGNIVKITTSGSFCLPIALTTTSAGNTFMDNANGNRLLRSTSSGAHKNILGNLEADRADRIVALSRPVLFTSTLASDDPQRQRMGLIAEDVHAIEPMLVDFGYGDDDYEDVEVEVPDVVVRRDATGQVVRGTDGQPVREKRLVRRTERRLKADATPSPQSVTYALYVCALLDVVRRQGERISALEGRL